MVAVVKSVTLPQSAHTEVFNSPNSEAGGSMRFLSPINGLTKSKSVGTTILESFLHTSNGKHNFVSTVFREV